MSEFPALLKHKKVQFPRVLEKQERKSRSQPSKIQISLTYKKTLNIIKSIKNQEKNNY